MVIKSKEIPLDTMQTQDVEFIKAEVKKYCPTLLIQRLIKNYKMHKYLDEKYPSC